MLLVVPEYSNCTAIATATWHRSAPRYYKVYVQIAARDVHSKRVAQVDPATALYTVELKILKGRVLPAVKGEEVRVRGKGRRGSERPAADPHPPAPTAEVERLRDEVLAAAQVDRRTCMVGRIADELAWGGDRVRSRDRLLHRGGAVVATCRVTAEVGRGVHVTRGGGRGDRPAPSADGRLAPRVRRWRRAERSVDVLVGRRRGG